MGRDPYPRAECARCAVDGPCRYHARRDRERKTMEPAAVVATLAVATFAVVAAWLLVIGAIVGAVHAVRWLT